MRSIRARILLWLGLLALLLPFLFVYNRGQQKRNYINLDRYDKVDDAIMRVIPTGTSISQAKEVMIENGFSCSFQPGLECERVSSGGLGFKGTMWFVKFSTSGNKVVSVKVWVTPAP